MMSNLSASILNRLLALAKQRDDDYSLVLNRFALERLLCRLSTSPHADEFLLKGALLFALWYDEPHRPTRDVDLLGFGEDNAEHLVAVIREVAAIEMEDGIVFDLTSVRADAIREDNTYGGTRINLVARIGSARCALQIDIGFGDVVTPQAQTVVFPTLLADFQAPVLRVYPVYTVIAEKYHAMVVLGLANSRMKDFYDIAVIARRTDLDGANLSVAIAATFERRSTAVPALRPLALTSQFGDDAGKKRQWQAFLNKNRLVAGDLVDAVSVLDRLLWPPTEAVVDGAAFKANWTSETMAWRFS
ncbi:nucleotidyl transferase AbiEii/AbiGii toxin family protein [Variovorax sp. RHLX14]|uniref:nucleotidyl transferase AbiEii/AbiGii toxin family protein n=1 Tax=Variovorax sp. RHLX14 TaxID=1259731 RepID=UPI003F482CFC